MYYFTEHNFSDILPPGEHITYIKYRLSIEKQKASLLAIYLIFTKSTRQRSCLFLF